MFFWVMKKIWLLAEGELCENIYEILQLEGFDPWIVSKKEAVELNYNHGQPRMIICETGYVKAHGQLFSSPGEKICPLIILSPDGEQPSSQIHADLCLPMPFSEEILLNAVKYYFDHPLISHNFT